MKASKDIGQSASKRAKYLIDWITAKGPSMSLHKTSFTNIFQSRITTGSAINMGETGAEATMFQKQFYAITVNRTFMHSIENNARPFKKHRLTVSPDIATLNVKCMQKHPTYLYR
ncbi:hypothetical protein ILYODFUR_037767 [Ilyodon furcidens]|uniref:Uncharacterized protein n=1 Tax=Ilyodon furcidens TaxID=33524 RepID=A0ABV0SSG8_9TELE